jgi:hypothetical protein
MKRHLVPSPLTYLTKRMMILLLACVMAMAGAMLIRNTAVALENSSDTKVLRVYEEIEDAKPRVARTVQIRIGRHHDAERPTSLRSLKRDVLPPTSDHLPAAPRAPPHQPRAPPSIA